MTSPSGEYASKTDQSETGERLANQRAGHTRLYFTVSYCCCRISENVFLSTSKKKTRNFYILDNELIMNSNFDKNFAPQLLLGLENLYKDRIFVDTTLVIGKTEIPVHRCVISGI